MKMLSALASLRLQVKHITWPSDENQISQFFFYFSGPTTVILCKTLNFLPLKTRHSQN